MPKIPGASDKTVKNKLKSPPYTMQGGLSVAQLFASMRFVFVS
jgi:hypothetical protein